jgi:hypothetical protein
MLKKYPWNLRQMDTVDKHGFHPLKKPALSLFSEAKVRTGVSYFIGQILIN